MEESVYCAFDESDEKDVSTLQNNWQSESADSSRDHTGASQSPADRADSRDKLPHYGDIVGSLGSAPNTDHRSGLDSGEFSRTLGPLVPLTDSASLDPSSLGRGIVF